MTQGAAEGALISGSQRGAVRAMFWTGLIRAVIGLDLGLGFETVRRGGPWEQEQALSSSIRGRILNPEHREAPHD